MTRLSWHRWGAKLKAIQHMLPQSFRRCLACQDTAQAAICSGCLGSLEPVKPGCQRCGNPNVHQDAQVCTWCQRLKVLPECIATPWVYRETGRELYHLVKYQGYWRLLELLCQERVPMWQPFQNWQDSVLVPIPETLRRKWRRNFNPAQQIAEILAKPHGLPVQNLLKMGRFQRAMVGLDYEARRKNAKHRFKVRTKLVPPTVVLVDDVLTTGATLEAATAALHKLGVKKVGWFALFRTP